METVLTLMLVRFGLIALVVVVLALAVFAAVLVLRRSRRLDGARRSAASLARAASRHAEGGSAGGARARMAGSLARVLAGHLDHPAGSGDVDRSR